VWVNTLADNHGLMLKIIAKSYKWREALIQMQKQVKMKKRYIPTLIAIAIVLIIHILDKNEIFRIEAVFFDVARFLVWLSLFYVMVGETKEAKKKGEDKGVIGVIAISIFCFFSLCELLYTCYTIFCGNQ
jgi:hypothetical protein